MTVHIQQLFHAYPSVGGNVMALRGLDLELPAGQVCVVVGPNGSGKSTFIEILAGNLVPTSGHIMASNGELRPEGIAVVRQSGNISLDLTPREHAQLADAWSTRLETEIAHWGITPDVRCRALSTGQRQVLAVLIAVARKPALLLADEPAAALGSREARELYRLMADSVRNLGSTLLLVTHDAIASEFSDRVVRIRDGRISEQWTPGGDPHQVVDTQGWLRLPDQVRPQELRTVTVVGLGDDAQVIGNVPLRRQESSMAHFHRKVNDHATTVVQAASVAIRYSENTVIEQLSLQVREGDAVAVIGRSGSGKSSLLRVLAGLQEPASGVAEFDGVDWKSLTREQRSKVRGTELALFGGDLVLDYSHSLAGLGADPQVLHDLELAELRNRPLRQLSGGQRQRATIALALSHPAGVLLLDEPLNSLDTRYAHLVMDCLWRRENRTLLIALHEDQNVPSGMATLTL